MVERECCAPLRRNADTRKRARFSFFTPFVWFRHIFPLFFLAGRLFASAAFYVVPCLSPLSLAASDALLLRGVYFMCPCLRV
ncbi:MAG: hypothetical protein HPZ86_09565 [Clostridia bacterium]|jgi:hypothetical protein|nr:hypothetical protein [Clostridia bacterium]